MIWTQLKCGKIVAKMRQKYGELPEEEDEDCRLRKKRRPTDSVKFADSVKFGLSSKSTSSLSSSSLSLENDSREDEDEDDRSVKDEGR